MPDRFDGKFQILVFGTGTFNHRDKMKRHGGVWDADKKTWRVPIMQNNLDELAEFCDAMKVLPNVTCALKGKRL